MVVNYFIINCFKKNASFKDGQNVLILLNNIPDNVKAAPGKIFLISRLSDNS